MRRVARRGTSVVGPVVGPILVPIAGLLAAGCQHTLNPDNGRCGPTPRALVADLAFAGDAGGSVQAQITSMVLDGSDLYFVVGPQPAPGNPAQAAAGMAGAVMRVSTYGGTPAAIAGGYAFVRPALTPSTVILAETTVSGTGEVDIATVPRGGGTQTTLATLTGTALFSPPVTDGTSIYFGDGSGLESVPLAPPSTPVTPTRLSPASVNNLAVFGQSLLMLFPTGDIESLPLGAGDAGVETSLGTSLPSTPQTLIACGSDACWLAGADIDEIAPAGGAVATTATVTGPVAAPTGLVFDGTNFFVVGTAGTSTGTAAIARVPRQGGPQVVVATLPSSGPIAVDDACVYFATPTGIFSLQKNAEGVVLP